MDNKPTNVAFTIFFNKCAPDGASCGCYQGDSKGVFRNHNDTRLITEYVEVFLEKGPPVNFAVVENLVDECLSSIGQCEVGKMYSKETLHGMLTFAFREIPGDLSDTLKEMLRLGLNAWRVSRSDGVS